MCIKAVNQVLVQNFEGRDKFVSTDITKVNTI